MTPTPNSPAPARQGAAITVKGVRVSEPQHLAYYNLPEDGSWVERGSSGHTTRSALARKGLIDVRYITGIGRFMYRRKPAASNGGATP